MEQHAINYSLDYSSLDLKTLDFSKNVPEKKESGEVFESKKSFDDYVKEVKNLKDTESRPKEISEKPKEEKLESNENLSEKLSSSDKKRNIGENYKNFSPDELKASKILKESGTVRDKKDLKFEVKSEKKSLENRKKLKLNDERPGNAEKSGEILLKNEKKSDKKTVLIDKIPELAELGVDSFKIEGRMKSAEYVGTVVSAYRYVLDHYKEDKKGAVATGKRILAGDFARTKTSYWYNFSDLKDGIENAGKEILNPNQAGGTGIYLGKIAAKKPCPKEVLVEIQKKLSDSQKNIKLQLACLSGGSYDPDPGDSIRIHTQNDTGRISHKIHFVEEEENGKRWIDIPNGFSAGDFVYLLQLKSNSRRYSKILPSDLSKFRRQPQDEILPVLDLTPVENKELAYFPEGIYVQVSSISDVFQAQILNPVRLILELNSETQKDLLNEKTVLPFSKKSVFISLDPFCPAAIEDSLSCTVKQLSEKGYRNFVANNLSHLEMLKGKDFNVVAGPYLYTFNRWAVSFLENQNITSFIMPYENSRKNLENTFEKNVRKRVLVPVFAYPALFRMRFKLPQDYNFTYFQDKEEVEFKAVSSQDGSFVMPEIPFSILDKIDILSQNGFKRYLIDFSKTKISRGELKSIQASMSKKQVLPEVSRFNWKNGFYNPEQIEAYKSLTNTTSKTNGKKPLKKSFRSKS